MEGPVVTNGTSLAGPGFPQLGFVFQGPSSVLFWAQVPEHSGKQDYRPTWPSLPSVLRSAPSLRSWCGRPERGLLGGKVCGTDGVGGKVGRAGPSGGWPSVVLKERQEVIVAIAWKVGGVQVGEELVRVCEFRQ